MPEATWHRDQPHKSLRTVAIAEAFHDEIGRLPTLPDLLEILAYGAGTLPDEALSDLPASEITELQAVPRRGHSKAPSHRLPTLLSLRERG